MKARDVGLTEDERELVEAMRAKAPQHPLGESLGLLRIIAIIDRLSAAPVDDERVHRLHWDGVALKEALDAVRAERDQLLTRAHQAEVQLVKERAARRAAPVDDRERVPEGWRVGTKTISDADGTVLWSFPTLIQNVEPPVLVPVSPSVDPKEEG